MTCDYYYYYYIMMFVLKNVVDAVFWWVWPRCE
jgi:hypothetical protein